MKLLFVTWDGPGTVYHETLFVPLLRRAALEGDEVAFLQFSWGSTDRRDRVHRVAQAAGVEYELIPVPRGRSIALLPLGVLRGLWRIVREIRAGHRDTIMARSMIPGGITLVAMAITRRRAKFIYDADGLAADERVEYGGWPRGGTRYRLFRFLERRSIQRAVVTLVRTQQAVEILARRTNVSVDRFVVVPNGKDPTVFRPSDAADRQSVRDSLNLQLDAPLAVHVGSAGPQYEPGFTIEVFRRLLDRAPEAKLLILTSEMNHDRFHELASELPPGSVIIRQADPSEVPALLAACDVGLAIRTPSFSQRAVAPIKVAEYLLCGLPVAFSKGVGDLDSILGPPVGFAVAVVDTTETAASDVANWILYDVLPRRSALREEARSLGLAHFSLDAGAAAYREAFARAEVG